MSTDDKLAVLVVLAMIALSVLAACGPTPEAGATIETAVVEQAETQGAAQETEVVQQVSEGLTAAFDYEMAARFGLDRQDNDLPDLPNTVEYVQNGGIYRAESSESCRTVESSKPTFTVYLNATDSQSLSTLDIDHYLWRISGDDVPEFELEGPEPCANLPEQAYNVYLTVTAGESSASVAKQVLVEDLLFVSIGDSYSSGEGNPERRHEWADPGVDDDFAGLPHIIAHRSTLAWPAQSALALELADPHTSVTYVSVAATGATIAEGLIGPHGGAKVVEELEGLADMDEQILQVKELIVDRPIDIMTMSIGGNDIGFSNIVTSLMIKGSDIRGSSLPQITDELLLAAIESGRWKELIRDGVDVKWVGEMLARRIPWERLTGLAELPAKFAELDTYIEDHLKENVKDGNIYIMEYPDPTSRLHETRGLIWCPEIMAHFGLALESIGARIDSDELQWTYFNVLKRLNETVQEAAITNGWHYVGGVANEFGNGGHGYCAPQPYEPQQYPGNPFQEGLKVLPFPTTPGVSWFRTAGASAHIEGPNNKTETIGTMHPNELGHRVMSEYLLAQLELPVEIPGISRVLDPQPWHSRNTVERPESGLQVGLGLHGAFLLGDWELGACFDGNCISTGAYVPGPLLILAGVPPLLPLAPRVEAEILGFELSTGVSPLGWTGGIAVGKFRALIDPTTGNLLAIDTGGGWVDLAGNLIVGNPIAFVQELFGRDYHPVEISGYFTTDDCRYTSKAVAELHQAELDGNHAWLEAHGYIKTDHYYSTEKCYPLKEWEPGDVDTDQDGLSDYFELNYVGSDPNDADTDDDGLPDGYEYSIGTWYGSKDSDFDGVPDKSEDDWWQSLTVNEQDQIRVYPNTRYCKGFYHSQIFHPATCYRVVPPPE